jgi:Domain of unknown function (DUF6378)
MMSHEPISQRSQLLAEADEIVNKDRNSVYGNPEDNFKDIAQLWAAYKGVSFTSMDVVVMNMLIKVARLKKTPGYHDGLVDIAGYAACGADIQANMLKRDNPQGETVQDIIHSQHYERDRNR